MSSPTPTTKELLNRLASWKPSVRQSAIEQAKQLEPDALLDLMQQGRRRLQKRHRQRWLCIIVYVAVGLVLTSFMPTSLFRIWRVVNNFICPIGMLSFIGTVIPPLRISLTAVFEDMQKAVFIPHLLTLLASGHNASILETQKVQSTLKHLIPYIS